MVLAGGVVGIYTYRVNITNEINHGGCLRQLLNILYKRVIYFCSYFRPFLEIRVEFAKFS